jgi:phage N-6-adenine-methyltransferase
MAVNVPISTASFQAYRTPHNTFSVLNADLGPFGLDAAADSENAKCYSYIDESMNALADTTLWYSPTGNVFCNPPYKKIGPWIERAERAVEKGECTRVVFLLPAMVSSKWFVRCAQRHEVQLYQGRIPFDLPAGVENKRSPAISNCVVVIEKDGLRGVTAWRDAKTGVVVFDYTDLPTPERR